MRLWTVQPVEVWKNLQEVGCYVCDKSKSESFEDPSFVKAYDWLVAKMEKRIGARPKGVEYPVWAWHTYDGRHCELDLNIDAYVSKGEEAVCLEVEIPDGQVLLSDFNNWHSVLNNTYCDRSLTEEEWEKETEWFSRLRGEERQKVKLDSWNRIFDITPRVTEFCSNGHFVQATFWSLKLEDVKKVRFFVGT